MSDYTQTISFTAKDALVSGNAAKIVLGADIDLELGNVQTAVNSKFDSADIASLGQAQAGTDNTSLMTPLRTTDWASTNAAMVNSIRDLADPNVDAMIFWDDSEGATGLLTPGANLLVSGLVIDVVNVVLSVTGGNGITNNGNATAVLLDLDFDKQDAIDISGVAADDLFAVEDIDDSNTVKKIAYQDFGVRTIEATTKTFALSDANVIHNNSTGSVVTMTVPLNASVAFPIGTVIGLSTSGAAVITIAPGSATVTSIGSLVDIIAGGGRAALHKIATDTWTLAGSLE